MITAWVPICCANLSEMQVNMYICVSLLSFNTATMSLNVTPDFFFLPSFGLLPSETARASYISGTSTLLTPMQHSIMKTPEIATYSQHASARHGMSYWLSCFGKIRNAMMFPTSIGTK